MMRSDVRRAPIPTASIALRRAGRWVGVVAFAPNPGRVDDDRTLEIISRMHVFPNAADCIRLVDFKSDEPREVQFDAALSLLYGAGCLASEMSELRCADIERLESDTKVAFKGGRGGCQALVR